MSLEDWLAKGWVTPHKTSKQEIVDLLRAADRDLADCKTESLSADWRLGIAHNSALMSAVAALAACGYRATREAYHYRVLQSLSFTMRLRGHEIARLDVFRKKRNLTGYERAGTTSEQEAAEMIALAESLRSEVDLWLRANYPELI
jgi:hypothetical protein